MTAVPHLTGRARLADILAWPVGRSPSPRRHDDWLRRRRIGAWFWIEPTVDRERRSVVRARRRSA